MMQLQGNGSSVELDVHFREGRCIRKYLRSRPTAQESMSRLTWNVKFHYQDLLPSRRWSGKQDCSPSSVLQFQPTQEEGYPDPFLEMYYVNADQASSCACSIFRLCVLPDRNDMM